MMTSSLCFSQSVYKTCQRQPTTLKLCRMSKFHKICRFENHVTRNDVIMMSLPKTIEEQWKNTDLCGTKQNIYLSKGFDESYPKCNFYGILCQKLWAFMSSFTMTTLQRWSCHVTLSAYLENIYFFPNSISHFRKIYQILGKLAQKQ